MLGSNPRTVYLECKTQRHARHGRQLTVICVPAGVWFTALYTRFEIALRSCSSLPRTLKTIVDLKRKGMFLLG
ncbi:Uncharacterised protein [Salmonella enterica subsp. enterica serovar Typhimurium]|nr:Uncharacterised protein [Salmonella enterica subsp. enterica serovar Typhimurium]